MNVQLKRVTSKGVTNITTILTCGKRPVMVKGFSISNTSSNVVRATAKLNDITIGGKDFSINANNGASPILNPINLQENDTISVEASGPVDVIVSFIEL